MLKAERKQGRTEGRPRSTPAERRARSETRIITAALRLIGERGTIGTTLADIAKAARCSQGLTIHLFGTKEAIVIRAVQAMITFGRGLGLLGSEPEPGFSALLDTAAGWFPLGARHKEQIRALLVLFDETLLGHATKRYRARAAAVRAMEKDARQHIRRILEVGIARGEVRSDINLDIESALILSGARGVFSQWLILPEGTDLEKTGRYWLAQLKRTLSPTREAGREPRVRVGSRPRQNPPASPVAFSRTRKRSK